MTSLGVIDFLEKEDNGVEVGTGEGLLLWFEKGEAEEEDILGSWSFMLLPIEFSLFNGVILKCVNSGPRLTSSPNLNGLYYNNNMNIFFVFFLNK